MFPNLPERTRLFRPFLEHEHLTQEFLASPTLMGTEADFEDSFANLIENTGLERNIEISVDHIDVEEKAFETITEKTEKNNAYFRKKISCSRSCFHKLQSGSIFFPIGSLPFGNT